MQLTTYGYKTPANGDKGATFWDALAFNVDRLDGHSHNGADSVKLTAAASAAVRQDVDASGWTASGANGLYRQLVTVPGGANYDAYAIQIRDGVTQESVQLTVVKQSATTFYVYCNDNTKTLTVVYS